MNGGKWGVGGCVILVALALWASGFASGWQEKGNNDRNAIEENNRLVAASNQQNNITLGLIERNQETHKHLIEYLEKIKKENEALQDALDWAVNKGNAGEHPKVMPKKKDD